MSNASYVASLNAEIASCKVAFERDWGGGGGVNACWRLDLKVEQYYF